GGWTRLPCSRANPLLCHGCARKKGTSSSVRPQKNDFVPNRDCIRHAVILSEDERREADEEQCFCSYPLPRVSGQPGCLTVCGVVSGKDMASAISLAIEQDRL